METLETTETLADDSSRKRPESETLDFPVPETLALEPVDEVKTLAMPEAETELGLGLLPGESLGGDETPFAVGDFVWGKIKSHPWWPGQVYDPSGASDRAKKVRRKDHRSVLVAYFGDDTFAWCHPSQLKPFVENFNQMASQSSSKSFAAALESALVAVGRCLEVQMTCYCVPEEERQGLNKYFSMNARISNYLPLEFLSLIKDVAVDSLVVDILEITLLRSWVLAFGKGCSYIDSTVYHRRRGIMDLVDKIDLDAPPMDSLEGIEEEECCITGSGAVKGPEISSPDEKSNRSKKKRSMAALIAEMDLDSVDLSESEEEKKNESEKGSQVGNGGSVKEEETGSGRRERKKSKYLSPPYTYLSGYTKWLVSPKSLESKPPKNSHALHTGSSSAILKSNCEEFPKEEDEKSSSPLFKVDSFSTIEVLSEFLATALNPLHLKGNNSAKMVRGFFAVFRSSVYSSGAEFGAYQKQLADSGWGEGKIVNKDVGDKSEEGNKSEGKRGRKRKDKANGEREAPIDLGHHTSDHCEEKDKATPRRKMVKEGGNGKTPVNSELHTVLVSDEGKKRKSKASVNLETTVDLGGKPVNNVESGKVELKPIKGKEVANKKTLIELEGKSKASVNLEITVDLGRKPVNNVESGKAGQKPIKGKEVANKKTLIELEGKSKASVNLETTVDLGRKPVNNVESGKAGQKPIKGKEVANKKTLIELEGKSKASVNLETTVDLGRKPVNNVESGKAGQKPIKGKEVPNRKTLIELDREVCNHIKDANLGQKRRKIKNGPSIEVPINFVRKIANGSEEGTSGQKRKNKDATGYKDPAALLLTFSPGISLPSKEDFISTFSKYGPLIESKIELIKESSSARVVFMRSSDAEKAFNNKAGAFGLPIASYRLHYLTGNLSSPPPLTPIPVPKPPLPYIRKSLERMITTLNGTSPLEKVAGYSEGLKPEARDNLVGEMQGLLTKVNKMLSGPAAGTST